MDKKLLARLNMVSTIRILQFLIGLKIVVVLAVMGMLGIEAGWDIALIVAPSLIATTLVGIAAWLKPLERALGARYLPLLLGIAMIEQNIEYLYFEIVRPFQTYLLGAPFASFLADTRRNEMFFLVLVLTVLAAWQYGFRGALWSSIFAGGLHFAISLAAIALEWVPRLTAVFIPLQIILLVLVTYIVGLLVEQQRAQERELETAHRQLQQFAAMADQLARSRERNRMARDLHDTLAHSLVGLIVQLQAVRSLLPHRTDDASRELALAEQAARTGLDETRLAIRDLRASPIASLGLLGALKQEIAVFEQESAATVALDADEALPGLSEAQEEALWRVAQEALENIARHANATRVAIALRGEANRTMLTIADDGEGFDPRAVPANHFGLVGMRERVALIGGELRVSSAPGQGTRVECRVNQNSKN
ncbi:MAG: sensor histidine kinase [Chloroflexi bacterium]|nr:sensor histidine kinase [Chloroflexota bacterium]